jgi:hypothetical protein
MISHGQEGAGSLPRVLRPGVLVPLVGYTASTVFVAAAAVLAVIAPEGGRHKFPLAGDWSALTGRLIASIICVFSAWLLYQVGSNKIVLSDTSMQITTSVLRWTVERDEVENVRLTPSALQIALTDGCVIRPSMFWSTPAGSVYFALGLFKNAMSRSAIRTQILDWRHSPIRAASGQHKPLWPCRRHWRTRLSLGLLMVIIGVVATEAVLVTAFA